MPVVRSFDIPVNVAATTPTATNTTYIFVAQREELKLYMSAPRVSVDMSQGFKNLTVLYRIYSYAAHTLYRMPGAISRIYGAGTKID